MSEDSEREKALNDALTRMREAFADVSEEQLTEDIVAVVERERREQRKRASTPASA